MLQTGFAALFKFLDIALIQSVLKAQENDQRLYFVLWKRNRAVQERQVGESLITGLEINSSQLATD